MYWSYWLIDKQHTPPLHTLTVARSALRRPLPILYTRIRRCSYRQRQFPIPRLPHISPIVPFIAIIIGRTHARLIHTLGVIHSLSLF